MVSGSTQKILLLSSGMVSGLLLGTHVPKRRASDIRRQSQVAGVTQPKVSSECFASENSSAGDHRPNATLLGRGDQSGSAVRVQGASVGTKQSKVPWPELSPISPEASVKLFSPQKSPQHKVWNWEKAISGEWKDTASDVGPAPLERTLEARGSPARYFMWPPLSPIRKKGSVQPSSVNSLCSGRSKDMKFMFESVSKYHDCDGNTRIFEKWEDVVGLVSLHRNRFWLTGDLESLAPSPATVALYKEYPTAVFIDVVVDGKPKELNADNWAEFLCEQKELDKKVIQLGDTKMRTNFSESSEAFERCVSKAPPGHPLSILMSNLGGQQQALWNFKNGSPGELGAAAFDY